MKETKPRTHMHRPERRIGKHQGAPHTTHRGSNFNISRVDKFNEVADGATQLFGFYDAITIDKLSPNKYEIVAQSIYDVKNALQFFIGGILVGFGTRYANGCTAGHCIMGVSQFALSSILATIAFFVGGLIGSLFIVPAIY